MFSKIFIDDNTVVSRGQYLKSLPRLSSRDEEQLTEVIAKLGLPNEISALGAARAVQTLLTAYSDEDAVRSFTVAVLRDIASWLELEVYPSCYHSTISISVGYTFSVHVFVTCSSVALRVLLCYRQYTIIPYNQGLCFASSLSSILSPYLGRRRNAQAGAL